jgi:hypothetical protein
MHVQLADPTAKMRRPPQVAVTATAGHTPGNYCLALPAQTTISALFERRSVKHITGTIFNRWQVSWHTCATASPPPAHLDIALQSSRCVPQDVCPTFKSMDTRLARTHRLAKTRQGTGKRTTRVVNLASQRTKLPRSPENRP